MRLVKRAFKRDTADDGLPATEVDFLREFLQEDLPTGTLLMPILGDSGIGKSHLVRWLDVQLKRLPDSNRRHVIRIPKSSSLKTVLYHILENLQGDQYDEIRRQLKTARERLDVIGSQERIRAEVLAAIRRRFNDACQNREDARSRGVKIEQLDNEWFTHGDPQRCLPALLSYRDVPVVYAGNRSTSWDHLSTGKAPDDRLVGRSASARKPSRKSIWQSLTISILAKRAITREPYLRSLDRLDGGTDKLPFDCSTALLTALFSHSHHQPTHHSPRFSCRFAANCWQTDENWFSWSKTLPF